MCELFEEAHKNFPNQKSLSVVRNNKEIIWTWKEYYNDTIAFAKSLHALGVTERASVNIMGFNSPEWVIAWHGAMFHNNIASGVYITNTPDVCLH